jgi:Cd2+/Zn2+-exporting ATPase
LKHDRLAANHIEGSKTGMTEKTYTIHGMDCADCALTVEKGVRQLPGVKAVRVDFSTGLLTISGDPDPGTLRQRVETLGYGIASREPTGARPPRLPTGARGFWMYLRARRETRLALLGGVLLALSLAAAAAGALPQAVRAVQIVALAIAGFPIARSAIANLWINREISINLLMTLAAIGAVIIGETAEAATLIFLFAISEALEGFTAERARRVLDEMGDLIPARAVRLHAGREEEVPVSALRVGDAIIVRAGERIPMDGTVQDGSSAVNQAPITGESLPVEKSAGDAVYAGTVNGSGVLQVGVDRLAADTTIQRIIRMIEQAQSVRAPTQRFIDRFARIYTPAVVLLAALVAVLPPILFAQPFYNTAGETGWLHRALALLVISCPCALVISAPVTIVSAITAAARRGVLIKGGAFLEALAGIRVFAFDKTGTLTRGAPVVTAFRAIDCTSAQAGEICENCEDVLALASALERRSAHPLAMSVVTAAAERGLDARYAPAGEVTAISGSGVQGRINGRLAAVGSHAYFERAHPHEKRLCGWVEEAEGRGETTMLVCDGERVRGFIAAADTLRGDSRGVVEALKAQGMRTALLTGDNPITAQAIGQQTGMDEVMAELLPEEKVGAVQTLVRQYGPTAMVGDGINDAPALAAASLGIAMGGAASAQAMETADIVLMGGSLHPLPYVVRLSAFAHRLIRQNVAIALATKLVFVLLATAGLTSLWLAVLADVGVSLVVTTNGMRANRYTG